MFTGTLDPEPKSSLGIISWNVSTSEKKEKSIDKWLCIINGSINYLKQQMLLLLKKKKLSELQSNDENWKFLRGGSAI